MSRNVRAVADAAGQLAAGELATRAAVRSRDEVGNMATSFNAMAESLDTLVNQVIAASEEVASSATKLSSAADELAATTTEQSAAVTEASATTEELARASVAIAETVDVVASQAAETRDNLEQAESDIDASASRTITLAERVSEIGTILALINEIADQTNLLALNAAIEAARAGEDGRGFAVVADEVRRLAERSKSSAAGIAEIVEGIQEETNATVMAMEKGAKQMQAGLSLLAAVADGTAQVSLTTQQQRSATSQVVETMEQLSDASRQVSATANDIAAASATLATLAANLERTGASAAADSGA
jgi:methyl-accepting chemotaxis protein